MPRGNDRACSNRICWGAGAHRGTEEEPLLHVRRDARHSRLVQLPRGAAAGRHGIRVSGEAQHINEVGEVIDAMQLDVQRAQRIGERRRQRVHQVLLRCGRCRCGEKGSRECRLGAAD